MYHFQRQILKEAEKYRKPILDGTAEKAMDNLDFVDVVSEGGTISEENVPKLGQAFDAGGMKTDVGPKLFGHKPRLFAIIPRKGTKNFTLSYLDQNLKPDFNYGDFDSFDKAFQTALKISKAGKVLSLGKQISTEEFEPLYEASSTTIVGYDRQSHGKEDLNKRTAENLRKYRVPPSFITNYGTLRKRKESLPGARIMWSKDDRDLDVIPAKDIQRMEADGWVIIEGVMSMGDDDFVIFRESLTE
jgi:hypothetical protein